MQDKWKAFRERHEQVADKFWQEHQEKVREVNGRYAHEIAKSKKLEEEVKSLSAKLEDLKKLEESKRKKLEEEVKSLSSEVEELEELVCFGGDEEEEVGSVEQRIHACPCQTVASLKVANLTKQLRDLNSEWSKDKRRVGFLQYLKNRKLKDGQYHRGYVFKEERVGTRVEEEMEEGRQEGVVGPTADEQEMRVDQHVQPPKDLSTRAVQRAARDLVENLVYMADGGRANSARIFECLLRNPTIKTVMEHVPGLTVLRSKDQKDLVQLKKIVGSVSITLEKMLKHISYEQCRIAYNAVAVAFAPDLYTSTEADFRAVETWTCFSRKKLCEAAEVRRDFLSADSWAKGEDPIFKSKKAMRRDCAELCKREHIEYIKEAWLANSKDSPAMHNFSKDPECTEKHVLNTDDCCIVCPVDCNKKHIRYAEMTTDQVSNALFRYTT